MSRPLKYKAWDGKEMHEEFVIVDYKFCIEGNGSGCPINAGLRDMSEKSENWQVLELSGETDDNGNELFEGDVFDNSAAKWAVVFNRGCFCGRIIQGKELNPRAFLYPDPKISQIALRAIKGKTKIGNIFQNPEFLRDPVQEPFCPGTL